MFQRAFAALHKLCGLKEVANLRDLVHGVRRDAVLPRELVDQGLRGGLPAGNISEYYYNMVYFNSISNVNHITINIHMTINTTQHYTSYSNLI